MKKFYLYGKDSRHPMNTDTQTHKASSLQIKYLYWYRQWRMCIWEAPWHKKNWSINGCLWVLLIFPFSFLFFSIIYLNYFCTENKKLSVKGWFQKLIPIQCTETNVVTPSYLGEQDISCRLEVNATPSPPHSRTFCAHSLLWPQTSESRNLISEQWDRIPGGFQEQPSMGTALSRKQAQWRRDPANICVWSTLPITYISWVRCQGSGSGGQLLAPYLASLVFLSKTTNRASQSPINRKSLFSLLCRHGCQDIALESPVLCLGSRYPLSSLICHHELLTLRRLCKRWSSGSQP